MVRHGWRAATRSDLEALPAEVAPRLLGARLETVVDGETVAVRITEVEAYHGRGTGPVPDPGSHARMGPTARNATMWGEPGHLYVYLSHGIHSCVNVVCGPDGVAGGVLLRAGQVIEGVDAASRRRPAARTTRDLARGPGRFGDAVRSPTSRRARASASRASRARLSSPGATGCRATPPCRPSAGDAARERPPTRCDARARFVAAHRKSRAASSVVGMF
jgi:DNA-3-methyladenine glycosylase